MGHVDSTGAVSADYADLMVKLASAYPGTTLTELQIRVYARALFDVPVEQLRQVFVGIVRRCRRFPTIAEIRDELDGPVEDAALLAWVAFCGAADKVGAYRSLKVEDGIAVEALERVIGGWPVFCELEEGPRLFTKRQEFIACYRDLQRQRGSHGARVLLGLCAAPGESVVSTMGRLTSRREILIESVSETPKALPNANQGKADGATGRLLPKLPMAGGGVNHERPAPALGLVKEEDGKP